MNDPHDDLKAVFVRVYQSTDLSGQAFANRIGISQQQWSAVLRGDRKIGDNLIAAMVQAFPEVGPDVLRYYMTMPRKARPQPHRPGRDGNNGRDTVRSRKSIKR